MIEDLKVTDKKSEIGYYSGVVVRPTVICFSLSVRDILSQDSLFAVCQLLTSLQWGRLSGMRLSLTFVLAESY